MTTTTVSKPTTAKKANPKWTQFASFIVAKLTENIQDMIVTVATCGMLLAYLTVTQPEMALQYSGYIIAIYVLVLLQRLVQDFDESFTLDELGERVVETEAMVKEIYRRVRNESTLEDDDVDQRLQSIM